MLFHFSRQDAPHLQSLYSEPRRTRWHPDIEPFKICLGSMVGRVSSRVASTEDLLNWSKLGRWSQQVFFIAQLDISKMYHNICKTNSSKTNMKCDSHFTNHHKMVNATNRENIGSSLLLLLVLGWGGGWLGPPVCLLADLVQAPGHPKREEQAGGGGDPVHRPCSGHGGQQTEHNLKLNLVTEK